VYSPPWPLNCSLWLASGNSPNWMKNSTWKRSQQHHPDLESLL